MRRKSLLNEKPLSYFSLRNYLIRLNIDLMNIENYVDDHPVFLFPPDVYRVIIFAEDRRFNRHIGFDAIAIIRECIMYFRRRKMYGASTIDMQFVRTCLNKRDRTAARKITEIILSVCINVRYSKEQILCGYMRYAYFGHGITGIDQAVDKLFPGRYRDFTLEEMATLAASLVFPIPSRETGRWRQNWTRRRDLIASRIRANEKRFKELPRTKIG